MVGKPVRRRDEKRKAMPGYPLRLTADELAASGAAQRPPRTDVDLPREGKEAVDTNYSVPGNCNPGTQRLSTDH